MAEEFDYVIVGAGSAGCVLAARLTEDPKVSVLVLEFGGSDTNPISQMPSAFSMPMLFFSIFSNPTISLLDRNINLLFESISNL